MRMGLVGFADDRHLRNLLATRNRNVRWEPWHFSDADALWVNGATAEAGPRKLVRVNNAHAQTPAVMLDLEDLARPAAFTLPVTAEALRAQTTFDPYNAESVAQVFGTFESKLLDAALELTLASQVAARRYELSASTYHLTTRGKLVAVVNIMGTMGIAPGTTPAGLDSAEWSRRPGAAAGIPSGFRPFPMAQAMWRYIDRTPEDLLPERYRTGPIHFRAMPPVPAPLVRDPHLLVLAELRTRPQSFAELALSTGLPEGELARVLASLYFATAITMDPRKAAQADGLQQSWAPSLPGSDRGSVPPRPGTRGGPDLPTMPSPLGSMRTKTR